MTIDRRTIADALFTAAVMGIGFATGVPTVTTIVGGIGVNIAADLIQAGWGRVCPRLLGETGLMLANGKPTSFVLYLIWLKWS